MFGHQLDEPAHDAKQPNGDVKMNGSAEGQAAGHQVNGFQR